MYFRAVITIFVFSICTPTVIAAQVIYFDDQAAFEAVTSTTIVDFEGLAPSNGFWPPPPLNDTQMLTAGGIPFSVQGPGGYIVVAGPNAGYAGAPYDSALLTTDTRPIVADVSGVAGGVTAVGGFFGNIAVPTDVTTLTLVGASGVLDQRMFFAPDMGAGSPRKFSGWVVIGDTIESVTHNIAGNYEGLDDFQYGSVNNVTVVDVIYSSPADPNGPLSLGLESVPDEIPAKFIIAGLPSATGVTTFDEDDVLFVELNIGDGAWTIDDLVNFSLQIEVFEDEPEEEERFPMVTNLTYELGSITTATAIAGPILNSSFQLHVGGTDISSGLDFDYLHQDSMQALASTTPGDFDVDDDADGFDFLLWQRGLSPDPLSQADLAEWEANYGTVAPLTAASAAVPEPSALALLSFAALLFLRRQRNAAVGGTPV